MTKRAWTKRDETARAERLALRAQVLKGGSVRPALDRADADYSPTAAYTIVARNGEGWFDLVETRTGIGAAMERAAAWRQDERLVRYEIAVFAGSRADGHCLRQVASLGELE